MLCIDDAMIHVALLFYEEKRSASNATATVSCRLNLINDYVETTGLDLSIMLKKASKQSKGLDVVVVKHPSFLSPLLLIEHIFSLISRPKNKIK